MDWLDFGDWLAEKCIKTVGKPVAAVSIAIGLVVAAGQAACRPPGSRGEGADRAAFVRPMRSPYVLESLKTKTCSE